MKYNPLWTSRDYAGRFADSWRAGKFLAALSYKWGTSLSKQSIIFKSCDMEFRMKTNLNLQLALEHLLVGKDKDLVRWVDAICTNQSDDEEKALQLPYIREMYVQAEDTFDWLRRSIIVNLLPVDNVVNIISLLGQGACGLGLVKFRVYYGPRQILKNQELCENKLVEIDGLYAEQFKSWEQFADLLSRRLAGQATFIPEQGLHCTCTRNHHVEKISPCNGAGIESNCHISAHSLQPLRSF